MQRNISFKLLPSEAANDQLIKKAVIDALSVSPTSLSGYKIQKKSIDARGQKVVIHFTVTAYINEPPQTHDFFSPQFKAPDTHGKKVIIVLAKEVPAPTAMGNYIPAAVKGEIFNEY